MQQQQESWIIGCDVAKAELVTAAHGQAAAGQVVRNDSPGIQAWLSGLPAGSVVAMEATGRYHRLLAGLAHAAGMRVYVLNARDVYFYAKALGMRSKTDRVDAGVIARYAGEQHDRLHVWSPAQSVQQELHELLRRRACVTRLEVSLRQTLADVPVLRQATQQMLEQFGRLLEQIDQCMAALVEQDERVKQGAATLRTISGIGPLGSIMLAALFSRIEFANADAVVGYSGLDPRACDSGTRRGKRRLSKRGPAWMRRQMYLAAFAASHSKALAPLYQSIKARGFAPTQALVILARKLLRVAWAVWRSGKPFEAHRLLPAAH